MSITFHSKPNNNNYITYVVYPGHFSRYSAPYFSWPCSSRWKDAKGVWWVQVFVYVFKIILICLHFFISFWQIWRKLDNAVWTGYSFCYHMFSQCSLAVSVFTVLSLFWSFKIDFFFFKLTEVHGKVIHVVQRAPPSLSSGTSDTQSSSQSNPPLPPHIHHPPNLQSVLVGSFTFPPEILNTAQLPVSAFFALSLNSVVSLARKS